MASRKREIPDRKQFEQLVARIEEDAGPLGLTVVPLTRLCAELQGRKRKVDPSVCSLAGNRGAISGSI